VDLAQILNIGHSCCRAVLHEASEEGGLVRVALPSDAEAEEGAAVNPHLPSIKGLRISQYDDG
jgi:hypothetical protein